MDSSFTHVS